MAVFLFTLLFSALLACANSQAVNGKNLGGVPSAVDSRFFGLGGGIGGLINSLLPGFNLGNQGGPGRNPPGMDFPANSQFYPDAPIQGQNPPVSSGQGGTWPVIDDASQFPNNGNLGRQPQYGPQGSYGAFPPQYPNQGNYGRYPPYKPGNSGTGPRNPMYSQYPNPGDFGGGNNQYPNQGGYPGYSTQMPQYPNQGNFLNPENPNQGNFVPTQPQNPSYPGNGGNPLQNQFPNQGGNWNNYPNNFEPGTGQGDGTLDSLVPPTNPQDPWNSDAPNDFPPDDSINTPTETNPVDTPPFQNPSNGNAILGRPVLIPPSSTESGNIKYPSSTESPAKRQCVQDCQTTTEYNPVCGSDNITYINPGKFVCARNCGINVFVERRGRCPGDTPFPRNVISSNIRP